MRSTQKMAALAVGALVLTIGASPASAAESPEPLVTIAPEDEQASRAFMTEFGVAADVQDALLDKARHGQSLLADSETADPVSVTEFTRDASDFEVATFEDGSISVVEREIPVVVPEGTFQPRAVTGCTVGGGPTYTTYNNCKVHYRTPIFSYGFYTSFTMTGSSATISTANQMFHEYSVGHLRDSWNLTVARKTGNAANPAHVQMRVTYTLYPGVGQINKGVRIFADGLKYWQQSY
ncbi:hypothetical protein [Oerskovia enterophila]|nr:hypothetical protein [Oerskovia enterophila]